MLERPPLKTWSKYIGQKDTEARCLVKGTSCRIAPTFQGKNAGREDCKVNETNARGVASAGSEIRYEPGPSSVNKRLSNPLRAKPGIRPGFLFESIGPDV